MYNRMSEQEQNQDDALSYMLDVQDEGYDQWLAVTLDEEMWHSEQDEALYIRERESC